MQMDGGVRGYTQMDGAVAGAAQLITYTSFWLHLTGLFLLKHKRAAQTHSSTVANGAEPYIQSYTKTKMENFNVSRRAA